MSTCSTGPLPAARSAPAAETAPAPERPRRWPDGSPVADATEAALIRISDTVRRVQAKHRDDPAL
ncbi:hypothetical protein [Planomonospora sp. ID82291]|uniref:hypothetical protein n=1 Tax=Planomonospora sp. ID82291 TaxID=2738136 RepID=UPI0018C402DE|nr:hypothetical protein [Planomonospora sp. ID82291]MBG0818373.1 hypothetical protein [Planomonospora sp. ID82291]